MNKLLQNRWSAILYCFLQSKQLVDDRLHPILHDLPRSALLSAQRTDQRAVLRLFLLRLSLHLASLPHLQSWLIDFAGRRVVVAVVLALEEGRCDFFFGSLVGFSGIDIECHL